MCYYGSTTKERLCQRMAKHRTDYNSWKKDPVKYNPTTSFKFFEKYGVENCRIVLMELCPCDTKDELSIREAYYIRNFLCVNKNIPDRKQPEYQKKYRDEHALKAAEYRNNTWWIKRFK